ncbi:hydroxymyristoyl-ACP dehydratase [Gillisia sp. M10.2A]|uniref:Hydroxymyristoyl-ACP dehydratase n=1 Tax=Gillisia lutea TaxID=2909668 RepID=A0ABS9EFH8_9FLAO|nr:hydroxymyristoyl-ACP dehydratase [Gillisia lutea]MCF4101633.1 hydroxymyristoyl-ACP dehydratase [Gillisia lutea]
MLLKDFYTVKNSIQQDGEYITQLQINKEHKLYKGHFPERPVTAGVILMQLFKEEAERITGHQLQLSKANNIKFMVVVDPDVSEDFVLHSTIEIDGDRVKLKGFAKHNEAVAIKINTLYKITS